MISRQILEYALECRMTIEEISTFGNISVADIEAILQDKQTLSAEAYASICDYLNVPCSKFMKPKGSEEL